ncbi:MAG: helix-turn-helix transcriptional regulator, partial [Treponema sp.]|nr:helix-turn-helix transcriptional regulator [Treponema sp.]
FPIILIFVKSPYGTTLFWAIFTFAYQIPGLLYCRRRLLQKGTVARNKALGILTRRESEVALAICEGLKYEEIAEKLFVSLSAVKKHAYNIYRKLNISNNRELMRLIMEKEEN